ncbi:MAG: ABC transporter ATP-binding protein [Planctomycetes bacterium]|nr:ABC transporter ATP-binding protein [Planctomycetota bacterium]
MLELTDVRKSYARPEGRVDALGGVSLSAASGEFIAVTGPSGCGKTTLLLTAGGLLAPDAGRVLLDGEDLYSLSAERRARIRAERIGFVFQQFHLIPYLSVLENVLVPSLGVPCRDAPARARTLIERFGLAPRAHHVPAELSTGERQRTALARALFNRPKLVLADEPTGNLDQANAEVVLQALAEFAGEGGTVLLVTHGGDAARYASRGVAMKGGTWSGG